MAGDIGARIVASGMVVERSEVWWAELPIPHGSEAGFRRPVLIVQSNSFNRSRLQTVLVVPLTSNLKLLDAPGNVLIPRSQSKLEKDSVAQVSLLHALDRSLLMERVAMVPKQRMREVELGLKLVLDID